MYRLVVAETFKEDVKSSVSYIKYALQAPVAADRLKLHIRDTYKSIKDTPFIYPAVPNEYLASQGFRFAMVKNYMLFNIIRETEIHLIRFLYGRRDWLNLLNVV
jgi:plasmid stabilization system protein ParE